MKKRSNQDGRDSDTSSEVDSDKMISRRGKRVKSKSKKHKGNKRGYSSHDDDDVDNSSRTSGSESLDSKEESKIKRSKRKRRKRRRQESSEDNHSSSSDEYGKKVKMKKHQHKRKTERRDAKDIRKEEFFADVDDDAKDLLHPNDKELVRKVLGLDWMLRPASRTTENSRAQVEEEIEEPKAVEAQRSHLRELNPYLKDNGSGYPDDASISEPGDNLFSTSVVGDGGASWRLKALKRAKEQAAREGRKLDEVVGEPWGSLGHLTASVADYRAASAHAHLHAIKDRKRGQTGLSEAVHLIKLKETFKRCAVEAVTTYVMFLLEILK